MLWRVMKHDLMRRIMQKRRAAFHRAENPAFAFDPQRLHRNLFTLGDPEDQRLGLMGIQVIQHDVPFGRVWIASDQALKMGEGIFLSAGRPKGRFDHLPGDDIEIDKPGQRPMSDIFSPRA
jgi:hypothetical protein